MLEAGENAKPRIFEGKGRINNKLKRTKRKTDQSRKETRKKDAQEKRLTKEMENWKEQRQGKLTIIMRMKSEKQKETVWKEVRVNCIQEVNFNERATATYKCASYPVAVSSTGSNFRTFPDHKVPPLFQVPSTFDVCYGCLISGVLFPSWLAAHH